MTDDSERMVRSPRYFPQTFLGLTLGAFTLPPVLLVIGLQIFAMALSLG